MFKVLLIFISIAFIGSQLARFKFDNGIAFTLLDVAVFLAVGIWLSTQIFKKKFLKGYLSKGLGLFFAACIVSLLANAWVFKLDQLGVAFMYLLRFATYSGLYFVVKDLSPSQKSTTKKAMFYSCVTILLLGVIQFIFYPDLDILYHLGWDEHLYRMFSTFLDPNYFGSFLVLFFLWVYDYKNKEITKRKKIILLLLTLILIAIILTYSRSAIIMAISGVFVYFTLKKQFLKMISLIVIFIISVFMLSNTRIEGLNPFRTASTTARVETIRNAITIIKDHPIFGVGFNTYRYTQNMYGFRTTPFWKTSHADAGTDNSFLFILATTGILGFVAYLHLLKRIVSLKDNLKGEGRIIFLTFICSLLIGSMFNNLLFYTPIMAWIWVYIGLIEKPS